MRLLVGIALAGLLALCLTSLYLLKDSMFSERAQKTEHLVKVGIDLLDHYHRLAVAGRMTDEEARQAAKEALRGVRYGNNDYFFIFDTHHAYVLNPSKPEAEGKDSTDLKDANGKFLVRELVAAAQRGGGHVDYAFPRAGQTHPEPKLSYAALYAPWDWVIGTGVYVDDIDTAFWRVAALLGAIALVLLVGLSLLGWQTVRSIIRLLGGEPATASAAMKAIASGNLIAELGAPNRDSLLDSLQSMADSLRALIREIDAEANSLVGSAEEIASASSAVSGAAEQQAEATSAIAAAIEQLTVSSNQILDHAKETEGDSAQAVQLALEGCDRVNHASGAIQKIADTVNDASTRIRSLESRAAEISSIASVIKDIAGQTNLLALNAAIEAARAGEQGRGFSVVADEVRKLAERTATATSEIETMLTAIQADTGNVVVSMGQVLPDVQRGVDLAASAADSLRAIERGARTTLDRVHDVANATREQSEASTLIAQRIEQIAQRVDETSATIRSNADTALSLEAVARNLRAQVARFVV